MINWYKLIKQVRSKVHFFQILSGPSLNSGENRCEHPRTNHFRGSLSMMKWSSAGTPSLVCVVFRIPLGLGVDHFTAKRHWGLPDHRLHDSVLVRRPDHEIRGQGRRRDGGRSEETVQHQGPVDVESPSHGAMPRCHDVFMRCQWDVNVSHISNWSNWSNCFPGYVLWCRNVQNQVQIWSRQQKYCVWLCLVARTPRARLCWMEAPQQPENCISMESARRISLLCRWRLK